MDRISDRNEFSAFVNKSLDRAAQSSLDFAWEDRVQYGLWLQQTLEYVGNSTRILALTAGMLPQRLDQISQRFIAHAGEEKGHEKLIHNDLKALGFASLELDVLPEAEAFHKSLYYWIFKGEALTLLGWVLALEGLAVKAGKEILVKTVEAHGPKASSFVRVHAGEDEDHLEKALASCEGLSESDKGTVKKGLELYLGLYASILRAIGHRAGSLPKTSNILPSAA